MKNFIKIWTLSLILMLGFSSPIIYSQNTTTPKIEVVDATTNVESVAIEDIANEVIKVITQDSTSSIIYPTPLDPTNSGSLFEWWMFLYGLLMPLGSWIFNKFFPSSTKKELILKSTGVALIVLFVILFMKGFSLMTLGQSFIAFIFQVVTYDKGYKGVGASSPRKDTYIK